MAIINQFGINPENRKDLGEDFRLEGAGLNNNNGITAKFFNELIFKTEADHVWGTEAQVKLVKPKATFYTDGSGNPLDSDDIAVVFVDDDRITMVHDVTFTVNLLLDAGSKRLNIKTDRGLELDLDGTYKVQFDNCDESLIKLKTSEDLKDSIIDNTFKTDIIINNQTLYNQPSKNLNLKVINNSTNPIYQIDVTFDSFTFYDDDGRSVVSEQTSPLVLDLTANRAVHVATEGSASEQASKWYYAHIYTRVDGVNDYLWSVKPLWSDVDSSDKPTYNVFVRTLTQGRNDGSSNFLLLDQVDNLVHMEKSSLNNVGATSSTSYVSASLVALTPETAIAATFRGTNSNGGGLCAKNTFGGNKDHAPSTVYTNDTAQNGHEIILLTPQTVYIYANAGTTNFGIESFRIKMS